MARLLLFIALVAFSALNVFAQRPMADLFQVDTSADVYGGCHYANQDNRLDQLVYDAKVLAEYGLLALQDYDDPSKPEARRLVDSWFILPTPEQRQIIESKYRQIWDWLMYGGLVDGGRVGTKPWLFCYHTWLERQAMNSAARDNQGNIIMDQNNSPVKISDIPEYVAQQQVTAHQKDVPLHQIHPYWSFFHHAYIFDKRYGNSPNTGLCSISTEYGQTLVPLLNFVYPTAIMTLCPSSFGTTNMRNRGWEYEYIATAPLRVSTRQAVVDSIANGQDTTQISTLLQQPFGPTVTTFFHELFHLVLGREDSYPASGEKYGIWSIFGSTADEAILNPETFTLVAIAYSYTAQSSVDGAGQKVEFYMGFANQG